MQVWNEVGALRVLHMEECGYLIHPSYMLEYMDRSLQSPPQLLFVVLDDDIPRVRLIAFRSTVGVFSNKLMNRSVFASET